MSSPPLEVCWGRSSVQPKKFQQGADEVLFGLGFVGVVEGGEVVEEAAGGVTEGGEGGGLGAALGGGTDAVGEEVLGEEVAGH